MTAEKSEAKRPATDRRDKPVEQEADKDIKEGGIEGARREQQKPAKEAAR